MVDKKNKISVFRGARDFYLSRPLTKQQPINMTKNLVSEIGGMFGIGSANCVTEIIVTKNDYYMGETAQVRVICDNSKCGKAIKSFKLKLVSKIQGIDIA